jgi:hypothetical protein
MARPTIAFRRDAHFDAGVLYAVGRQADLEAGKPAGPLVIHFGSSKAAGLPNNRIG